jgi:hypothetical protein
MVIPGRSGVDRGGGYDWVVVFSIPVLLLVGVLYVKLRFGFKEEWDTVTNAFIAIFGWWASYIALMIVERQRLRIELGAQVCNEAVQHLQVLVEGAAKCLLLADPILAKIIENQQRVSPWHVEVRMLKNEQAELPWGETSMNSIATAAVDCLKAWSSFSDFFASRKAVLYRFRKAERDLCTSVLRWYSQLYTQTGSLLDVTDEYEQLSQEKDAIDPTEIITALKRFTNGTRLIMAYADELSSELQNAFFRGVFSRTAAPMAPMVGSAMTCRGLRHAPHGARQVVVRLSGCAAPQVAVESRVYVIQWRLPSGRMRWREARVTLPAGAMRMAAMHFEDDLDLFLALLNRRTLFEHRIDDVVVTHNMVISLQPLHRRLVHDFRLGREVGLPDVDPGWY